MKTVLVFCLSICEKWTSSQKIEKVFRNKTLFCPCKDSVKLHGLEKSKIIPAIWNHFLAEGIKHYCVVNTILVGIGFPLWRINYSKTIQWDWHLWPKDALWTFFFLMLKLKKVLTELVKVTVIWVLLRVWLNIVIWSNTNNYILKIIWWAWLKYLNRTIERFLLRVCRTVVCAVFKSAVWELDLLP